MQQDQDTAFQILDPGQSAYMTLLALQRKEGVTRETLKSPSSVPGY